MCHGAQRYFIPALMKRTWFQSEVHRIFRHHFNCFAQKIVSLYSINNVHCAVDAFCVERAFTHTNVTWNRVPNIWHKRLFDEHHFLLCYLFQRGFDTWIVSICLFPFVGLRFLFSLRKNRSTEEFRMKYYWNNWWKYVYRYLSYCRYSVAFRPIF